MKAILLVFAVALAAGCVTKHTGVNGRMVVWKKGVTTREEVVRCWGNPAQSYEGVWIWRDWNSIGSKFKISYYHIGLSVSSSRVSTCEYRLAFDEHGILKSISVAESVPGGAEWTWNPFK